MVDGRDYTRQLLVFAKSVLGGLTAVVLMWFAILVVNLVVNLRHKYIMEKQQGGLGAVAGGVGYLVGMPSTVLLLTAAFGAGFYLTVRWIYHSMT